MAIYRIGRGGSGVVLNGVTMVPEDDRNRAWKNYLAWTAAGNTADPETEETIGEARSRAYFQLDEEAETLRRQQMPSLDGHVELERMRVLEAEAAAVDVLIVPDEYPLLEAEVPANGADVAAVAAAVLAARDLRKGWFANIEAERTRVRKAVADSTTSAEVDAALATRSWPVSL